MFWGNFTNADRVIFMKTLFFISCCLAAVATAQEPELTAPVKITQRMVYNSDAPVDYEARQKALAFKKVCEILKGVHDKESADAASDAIYETMLVVHVGGEAHRLPDEEMTGQESLDYWMAAQEAGKNLSKAFFYGSEKLAIAMGMPVELAKVPTQEQLDAAREYLDVMRAAGKILSGVVDYASAAAAVEPMKELSWRLGSAQSGMGDMAPELLLPAVGAEDGEHLFVPMALQRLQACRFYGSAELAVALGYPADGISAYEQLDEKVKPIFENQLLEALKSENVSGGPGLSAETAWILPEGMSPESLMNNLPACMKQDSSIMPHFSSASSENYAKCDVVAEWEGKSYKLELWFKLPATANKD